MCDVLIWMRVGFRILWLARSVKPLTEFPETREGSGLAPEHFPLALCDRQVFNLGPEALGHREWASGWITEVKPGCMPQIPECIVFRAGDWQFSFRARKSGRQWSGRPAAGGHVGRVWELPLHWLAHAPLAGVGGGASRGCGVLQEGLGSGGHVPFEFAFLQHRA